MMSFGLSLTSEVITFDQNWHYHLYLTSAGEKDLSSDAQIRVIGQMEPLTEKLSKISCHSMVKIACLNNTFLVVFFNWKQAQ